MKKFALYFLIYCFNQPALAVQYYRCGVDEDGCDPKQPDTCICIPYDTQHAQSPYCLDMDNLACRPQQPDEHCAIIFSDQNHCLATAQQSIDTPPCVLVSEQGCEHIYTCGPSGARGSCSIT